MKNTEANEETALHQRRVFKYGPIDGLTRLLQLLPPQDGYIQLRMFDSFHPDAVLSYMWGPASDSIHDIMLNGCIFPVRRNLFQFLRVASRRCSGQYIWIDAICINQEDDVEKSKQVERMHIVYRAPSTLVWLDDSPELDMLFAYLNAEKLGWGGDLPPAQVRKGLEELCRNPYWNRTWITQEILLSRKATLMNECHDVDFNQIGKLISTDFPDLSDTTTYAFWKLWTKHRQTYNDTRDSIWDMLSWRKDSLCVDPRDRIYALQALAINGYLVVKYDQPTTELFWEAGEKFEAWARPALMKMLLDALCLDIASLVADLAEQPERNIRIMIRRAANYDKLQTSRWVCPHVDCSDLNEPVLISESDVRLCGNIADIKESDDRRCAHVLYRPEKPTSKLVVPPLTWDIPLDCFVSWRPEGWESCELPKNMTSKRVKKDMKDGRWGVQLPAQFVVDCLSQFSP